MSSGQRAILLVEDNTDALEMYALGLSYAGYRALVASDADSALVQSKRDHPDAVVTDLQLFGPRGGWELIAALKTDPATRDIPVVVLTGRTEASIASRARSAGYAALLVKPCLPDELAIVLKGLLHDA